MPGYDTRKGNDLATRTDCGPGLEDGNDAGYPDGRAGASGGCGRARWM